jgi:hypothetical protein
MASDYCLTEHEERFLASVRRLTREQRLGLLRLFAVAGR